MTTERNAKETRATRQTSEEAREAAAQTGATSSGVQYAKAPSMIWFIVPMAVLLLYGFLSR